MSIPGCTIGIATNIIVGSMHKSLISPSCGKIGSTENNDYASTTSSFQYKRKNRNGKGRHGKGWQREREEERLAHEEKMKLATQIVSNLDKKPIKRRTKWSASLKTLFAVTFSMRTRN